MILRHARPSLVAGTLWVAVGVPVAPALSYGQTDDSASDPVERCAAAEYRQFDFWIGKWEVRSPDDRVLGHNTIRRVGGGCGLLEEWRGAEGGRGVSVSTFEPDREAWTQTWVGSGATLHLVGELVDGEMVLSGSTPRATPRGQVLDRITWTPLADGRVRQTWDTSADGGESWSTGFVGVYVPLGAAESGS